MVDSVLGLLTLGIPNLVLALRFREAHFNSGFSGLHDGLLFSLHAISRGDWVLWAGINLTLCGVLFTLHRHVTLLRRIAHHIQIVRAAFTEEAGRDFTPLSIRTLSHDLTRFALLAQNYFQKYQEVSYELAQSRRIVSALSDQQTMVLATANREIAEQYQTVLAYANYLDEHIQRNRLDPCLRYDFDDVCESSFNLKLLTGALKVLRSENEPQPSPVSLATLMQQTVIALAPSLDRRSMKLTTAEVDISVTARSDAVLLTQVLWMILLGTIRYAASESTLRMRCLYSGEGTQAMMSIVISELAPGQLTDAERATYLLRQLQHLTPHMFAETIRIHANLQLAEMLLKRLDASIAILPLTVYACEICVLLPSYTPE